MKIGMLWFNNDTKAALEIRVQQAADYYRNKYGKTPNMCFVHPNTQGVCEYKTNGIELRTTRTVMPNHFWIGVNIE